MNHSVKAVQEAPKCVIKYLTREAITRIQSALKAPVLRFRSAFNPTNIRCASCLTQQKGCDLKPTMDLRTKLWKVVSSVNPLTGKFWSTIV